MHMHAHTSILLPVLNLNFTLKYFLSVSAFLKFNIMSQQNTDHENTAGLKLTDSPDICQAAVLCCHFPPLVANIVANYRRDI